MKHLVACALILALSACQAVLEDQVLPDAEVTRGQEEISIDFKPLTYEVARAANASPFARSVIRPGTGQAAGPVREAALLHNTPPPERGPVSYRLGAGDTLALTRLADPARSPASVQENFGSSGTLPDLNGISRPVPDALIVRTAKIAADGNLFFAEAGRVALAGKSVEEARNILSNTLVRNGIDPRFDLSITEFASQHVLFTASSAGGADAGPATGGSAVIPITDIPLSLRQLLVTSGTPIASDKIQVAVLVRGGNSYRMSFDYIFRANTPDYYLTAGDRVSVKSYDYTEPKGYLVGAIASPVAFGISPERRETLADILFVQGGAFETKSARQSEIYVLRGTNPVTAMHLDAKNPARVRIAAELELRPNDVVFVSEKPIYSLGKTIAALLPVDKATNALGN